MVFENDCSKLILTEFPEFAQSIWWKDHLSFWGKDKPGLSAEMSTFSHYVSDELQNNKSRLDFVKVFEFIEYLMTEGDQTVKDAAGTCFLENFINYVSHEILEPYKFVHLLGPKSKEYCKAWDEFTGVKTEGLWNDKA